MKSPTRTFQSVLPLFLLVFAITLSGQTSQDALQTHNAEITFDVVQHDFGEIYEGEVARYIYTFKNSGAKPLVISNVKGSCGCTVPQWPKEPIMPNETASLTVEFNSKGKVGKQTKRVTITANTDPALTYLTITGHVLKPDSSITEIVGVDDDKPAPESCFKVFPNPTTEVIKISFDSDQVGEAATIRIVTNAGQVVAERRIEAVSSVEEFSVGHYISGLYFVQVAVGDHSPRSECFIVTN